MASTPTIIPTLTPAQFAQRLGALFPDGWASADAVKGGAAFAFLLALSQGLTAVLGQVQYADRAVLVGTETAPELDLAAQDFYGSGMPRPPGMSDAAYANQILSGLFRSAATRAALSTALAALTGSVPRMIEPWNPGDTGATDAVSFLDVDTINNPMRVSGEERYTGFIETAPAAGIAPLSGNAVPTLDDGLWIDVAGSLVADLESGSASSIYALINQIRAFGITIGVKIVGANSLPTPAQVAIYDESRYNTGVVYG
jgi:hypothetical protein